MNKLNSTFVASLTWIMKDSLGDELDVLDEPVEFLVGGDDLLPPIDKALLDKPREQLLGTKIKLYIEPEQGFGDFNEKLIFLIPREAFPEDFAKGVEPAEIHQHHVDHVGAAAFAQGAF